MSLSNPDNIFFTKNAGDIIFGKNDDYLVVSTEDELFSHENGKLTEKKSLQSNTLLEVREDLSYSIEKLEKKFTVDRKPKHGYDSIFEEEIYESADAVNAAIDCGQKFISSHQVYLGGFEHSKEELKIIQNLVICALGSSKIGAEYGAYILKHLKCLNTVKVFDANDLRESDLEYLKYGGYLTLS